MWRMAKNIRVSDTLYALAQAEARLQHRSLAQQVEYWAKLGMASQRRGAGESAVGVIEANVEASRRLDIRDVIDGRRTADYFHFIPKSVARASKPRFGKEHEGV
jgi:hypothetical protein